MKFADIKNDIAFKKVFGDINHKNILISFLNAVLGFEDEKKIVDVELVNPYQVPKIEDLKETILDIRATNQSKESFIVEMQKKDLGDFAKRSLYYTSKAYVSQLEKGESYSTLKKVYFIGILNFKIFDNTDFISRHLILNRENNTQELKDFEFSFIELPKFKKKLDKLNSILDKWVYFIKNAKKLDLVPENFKEQEFKEAFDIAIQHKWSKKELEIYEYITLKEMDEQNALETAENKGVKRGRKEGKAEGEKQAKIEIAKKSLSQGIDIDTIVLITGLTTQEIEELKDKN